MLKHNSRRVGLALLTVGATALAVVAGASARGQTTAGEPGAASGDRLAYGAPAPGRMFVTGRVLDPQGKPVPGAAVAVYARTVLARVDNRSAPTLVGDAVVGQARCDGSGRFEINAPRGNLGRYKWLALVALAPGHGIAWVPLDPEAAQVSADVALEPDEVIHGRVLDLQGRPVEGVFVELQDLYRSIDYRSVNDPSDILTHREFLQKAPDAWPRPVRSDAGGRFAFRGLGRGIHARLVVDDPRFAWQQMFLDTEMTPRLSGRSGGLKAVGTSLSSPLTMALEPARVLTGRVTDAVTSKPISGAEIRTDNLNRHTSRTGADGRFRVRVATIGSRLVRVTPPEGQPYLGRIDRFEWPKGAVEQSIDVALTRGVMIHGKVTVAGSGEPVPEATLSFIPRRIQNTYPRSGNVVSLTKPDGSFELVAEPGPGYLVVQGPTDDFVVREIGVGLGRDEGQPVRLGRYAHGFMAYDAKAERESPAVNIVLKRGVTVTGRAIGVDGQPVQDARMLSRIILPFSLVRRWFADIHGTVYDGHFALNGLDPDAEVPVYFLDPKGKRGATLNVSGKSAKDGPVTVRLEPCGAAKGRLVDPAGKPLSHYQLGGGITMVVSAGPPRGATQPDAAGMYAEEASLFQIDRINHGGMGIESDTDGRITLSVLIPGATYRFVDRTVPPNPTGRPVRKEFIVKPGETLDLGDIVIEKPQRSAT